MKIFYLSIDFEANWMEARSFCKTFDNMDLATFDSSYEWSSFLKKANSHRFFFDKWTHVGEKNKRSDNETLQLKQQFAGGISKLIGNSKHREWYWITTNRKIPFSMQFSTGQPNNYLGKQNCLGISKEELSFEFQDIDCHGRFEEKFICQKVCPN